MIQKRCIKYIAVRKTTFSKWLESSAEPPVGGCSKYGAPRDLGEDNMKVAGSEFDRNPHPGGKAEGPFQLFLHLRCMVPPGRMCKISTHR